MLTRDAAGRALVGGVRLDGVLTPAYVYDLDAIAAEARDLAAGFGGAPHLVAYAVKACSAGPIVRALAREGCGAEVVSGSELELALACGVPADRILFSGVAKTDAELDRAVGAGERGIFAIQMESVEEIARTDARAAALGRTARVALRINPGVEADTHAHVATGHDEAKFGILREDLGDAWEALGRARHVELAGLSTHVGSQLTQTNDYLAAADVLLGIAREHEARSGRRLAFVDFGGGFGIDYGRGCQVRPADFAREATARARASGFGDRTIVVEPGRSLVGAHGVIVASVVGAKRSRSGRRWLAIDAGMNDLIRPALYGALHRIEPADEAPPGEGAPAWRVVGPVCESSDDFGEHRFAEPPPARVVIRDAGAYGFTMASQYNGRALPTEVFVEGGRVVLSHRARSADDWVADRARMGAG